MEKPESPLPFDSGSTVIQPVMCLTCALGGEGGEFSPRCHFPCAKFEEVFQGVRVTKV